MDTTNKETLNVSSNNKILAPGIEAQIFQQNLQSKIRLLFI